MSNKPELTNLGPFGNTNMPKYFPKANKIIMHSPGWQRVAQRISTATRQKKEKEKERKDHGIVFKRNFLSNICTTRHGITVTLMTIVLKINM